MDPYATHAETIESALDHASRVNRLSQDAADEFASWARVRLLDNDRAILRKFAGRSSLRTFLITVVQRLYLDWRNAEWGKWRPTAEARRLGLVAIELERMVVRDRLTYDEAVRTLEARELATARECEAIWARLPRRPRRQRVDVTETEALAGPSSASDVIDDDEARAETTLLCEALAKAMSRLPPTDQLLIQQRYWSGHTVSRIATSIGHEQKALYRRFDALAAQLRRDLEVAGVSAKSLAVFDDRFLADTPAGVAPVLVTENVVAGPSNRRTGGEHG